MAELLAEYPDPVVMNGVVYRVQACGAPLGNIWEGWIEFVPADGGPALRSARETTQPNFRDAQYWASGLTPVYLEGSLRRTLNPLVRPVVTPSRPLFDGPAPEAVLDPFSVYRKGATLLRQELAALSAWHLVNIVRAYELSDRPASALSNLPAPALIDLIVAAVTEQTTAARPGR